MKPLPGNVPRPIAAAIFDFDETMIDLEPQHTRAYVRLCSAMGSSYADLPESFRHASGKRIIDDIREMRAAFGWALPIEALLERRLRLFDEECETSDLHLMDGVEEAVRALHRHRITLAVTSSAVRSSIDAILTRFGLREMFAAIIDGSDVARGKPDPQAYIVTAQKLAVDPRHCIVFEDSSVGVRAARAARMFCIAVRNSRAKIHQDLSAADLVVGSFRELDLDALVSSTSP